MPMEATVPCFFQAGFQASASMSGGVLEPTPPQMSGGFLELLVNKNSPQPFPLKFFSGIVQPYIYYFTVGGGGGVDRGGGTPPNGVTNRLFD